MEEVSENSQQTQDNYIRLGSRITIPREKALIIFFCGLLFLGGLRQIYLQSHVSSFSQYQSTGTPAPQSQFPTSHPISPTSPYQPTVYATGLPILPDLGLIRSTVSDTTVEAKYYNAGTIPVGPYKGYKRIIAEDEFQTPIGQRKYLFATNDDKTYLVQGNPDDVKFHPETSDWGNPFFNINREKVKTVTNLLDSLPQEIKLDSNFSLFRSSDAYVYTKMVQSAKDKDGRVQFFETFVTDFSSYHKLPTNDPDHTYYYESTPKKTFYDQETPSQKQDDITYNTHIDGDTHVIVVDSQGLAYSYNLTTSQSIATYIDHKQKSDQDYYNVQVAHTQKDYTNFPRGFTDLPNLSFTNSDLIPSQETYKTYNTSFPSACGGSAATGIVKDLSDADLVKIGQVRGRDVFVLKKSSHPLNTLEYNLKIGEYYSPEINNGTPKPSLDEYISKTPLLFMRDYWGRMMAFGEYDYFLAGGCGKPVIYLYPPKPTEITVTFDSSMQLDTDIPTYHHGWNIMAHPDGTLTDLQPRFTDCDRIDTTHAGSEYARDACKANSYPYLYWSGRSLDHVYPSVAEGWVVGRNELSDFMNKTLDSIGFTKQEKTDMLSYWIPAMFSKQAPYYRVAFLQTAQMNSLVPMTVTPRPDSVYRLFLDWSPLVSKPATPLTPQVLSRVSRQGFTLVEWGGLKQ